MHFARSIGSKDLAEIETVDDESRSTRKKRINGGSTGPKTRISIVGEDSNVAADEHLGLSHSICRLDKAADTERSRELPGGMTALRWQSPCYRHHLIHAVYVASSFFIPTVHSSLHVGQVILDFAHCQLSESWPLCSFNTLVR